MPNTKSAERRMRNSERKHLHNRSILSSLRRLEKGYRQLLNENKKPEAMTALREVKSSLDKAVKSGVVHRTTANRRKSRHAAALNRLK